jgi:hypothetical protein
MQQQFEIIKAETKLRSESLPGKIALIPNKKTMKTKKKKKEHLLGRTTRS